MDSRKIKVNKIQCKLCQDVIESEHVHDFKMCKCKACGVDGGKEYLRRLGNSDELIELSEYEPKPKSRKNQTIRVNKIQCKLCQDIIESEHVHDFKMCKCGACGVDGGKEYLKRLGSPLSIIDLSESDE